MAMTPAERAAARKAADAAKKKKKKKAPAKKVKAPGRTKVEALFLEASKADVQPRIVPAVRALAANRQPPSMEISTELQRAFDHFNATLFDNVLPHAVLTLTRLRKYAGMFAPKRWAEAGEKDANFHEIQLDAVVLREKGDMEALSTLVHEMAHLAVHVSGKGPKKGGYHCKNWARLMNDLGLPPVAVVKGKLVPGKETGANCTNTIDPDGVFMAEANKLFKQGFAFTWSGVAEAEKPKQEKSKKAGAKVAHTCPSCEDKAWGKASLKLVCGVCDEKMICEEPDGEGDEDDAE